MHDELGEVAWRRGRRWLWASIVLIAAGWAAGGVVLAGAVGGIAAGAIGLVATAWWLPRLGRARASSPQGPVGPAPAGVAGVADGIGLATGTRPTRVLLVAGPAHDLGVLPSGEGWDLLVTEGLARSHTLDEVEALGAAQLAALVDSRARRLRAASGRLGVMRWICVGSGFVLPFAFMASPELGGASLALLAGVTAAGWLSGSRVRFWGRVAVDAAAVATTRHPQPLVTALLKVAEWNGAQVDLGVAGWTGLADRFWVRGAGPNWTSTTSINGRVTDQRTREQVDDVHLIVRAALVSRTCVQGADADLASYSEVRRSVREAGRAAARGGTGVVHGIRVGLGGMVDSGIREDTARPSALGGPLQPVPDGSGDPQLPAAVVGLLRTLVGPHAHVMVNGEPVPLSSTPAAVVAGAMAAPTPDPGWYPDPWRAARLRWWDGTTWTPAVSP